MENLHLNYVLKRSVALRGDRNGQFQTPHSLRLISN